MVKLYLFCLCFLVMAACHHEHAGDHAHEHADETHSHDGGSSGDHSNEGGETHAHGDGEEHSHDGGETHAHDEAGDHDHGPEAIQITTWNAEMELFIEHEPFIAGHPTRFVTHVTHLDGWQPRVSGAIELTLAKPGTEPILIRDDAPVRDGIYIPTLTFPTTGAWEIEVRVDIAGTGTSQRIPVTVHENEDDAEHAHTEEAGGDVIGFLKEQQWKLEFASEPVEVGVFRPSFEANGMIEPRPGGEVIVLAPVTGRYVAPAAGLPNVGQRLEADQSLGALIAKLAGTADPAALTLAVEKAELSLGFAEKEHARIEGLVAKEALPPARLHEAELALANARAELGAAEQRVRQRAAVERDTGADTPGRTHLHAPFTGTVIESHAVAGALIEEAEPIVHLVDLREVVLEIAVPETKLHLIGANPSAWFELSGSDEIHVVSEATGARMLALGGKVDPTTRTVPLRFSLPNPAERLKIGMFARVRVTSGTPVTGPALPREALIEEAGQPVAYVQSGGESFERRLLRLGIRDRDRIQIISGLEPGERVVTRGAYLIRLASASTEAPSHGHAH